ncbi:MAG: hypothetical protein V4591_10220, partial [Bdellovibrionota bacterium]
MSVFSNSFPSPSIYTRQEQSNRHNLSSTHTDESEFDSHFSSKITTIEAASTATEEKNLSSNDTLVNELFEAFLEFKSSLDPYVIKKNKAKFVRILEKIDTADYDIKKIMSRINKKYEIEYNKKSTEHEKSLLEHNKVIFIEYIQIKLDKQNIFNITPENRHRIERKDKFENFLNSKLKDSTSAVLQDVFQLLFDFDVTPPEQVFQFFECFFKEGEQGPIFLNALIENIFDRKQVFLLLKLMRAIQTAAQKEMRTELYERSFVGSFLKKIESEIIFRFYEEPKNGKELLFLTLKNEPLEKLVDEGLKKIKAIFQKIESASVDNRSLTSGVQGAVIDLEYNFFTDTSFITAPIVKTIPNISEGSFANNATQDALLMASFF